MIARDVKHWWEASFNCGVLKSKQLLHASNAEVRTRKRETLKSVKQCTKMDWRCLIILLCLRQLRLLLIEPEMGSWEEGDLE